MSTFSSTRKVLLALAAFALVALALMALPAPQAAAQSTAPGKIDGQIVNGTKNASPSSTANLTITMYAVQMNATSMISTTTTTDANGKFAFSNLEVVSTTQFILATEYADVDYFSDILSFTSPASTTLPALISVYEPTTDASVVKITQMHFIFDVQAPWLDIQQIVAMENSSDRVYIGQPLGGPHRMTLSVPMLAKAINITFDDPGVDSATLRGDGILTYTLPIGPGKDQVVLQYAVPFTPPSYDFSLQLPNGAAKLGLYMVDVGATIQSQQLALQPNPMGNVPGAPQFIAVSGDNFAPGTTVKATFNNLPATSTNPTSSTATTATADNTQTIGLVVLGIAAVAAVGLIAYPLLRRRRAAPRVAAGQATNERMELLQDIADLDDEFEAKEITEEEYKKQRAELKAKLLELDK